MGNTVAKVAHGPGRATSKLEKYEGTHKGVVNFFIVITYLNC